MRSGRAPLLALALAFACALGAPARADYGTAYAAYERTTRLAPGAEREAAFGAVGRQLMDAVVASPDAAEAGDATLLAAAAFKQAGDPGSALAALERFVKDEGADERLALLRDGDPRARPARPPDPAGYRAAVRQLAHALDDLALGYLALFDYAAALQAADRAVAQIHLEPAVRRVAAQRAVVLHAAFGERDRARAARDAAAKLGEDAAGLSQMDLAIVAIDVRAWELAAANGARASREADAALGALRAYADRNKARPGAARDLAVAAVTGARIARAAKKPDRAATCKKAREAVLRLLAGAAQERSEPRLASDLAAACDPAPTPTFRAGQYLGLDPDGALPPPAPARD